MPNRLTSVTLMAALVIVLCGVSAFANNSSKPDVETNVSAEATAKKEVKPNEQLKINILKLVADAKAGKVIPAPKSQIQPAKSNNWSKGTKIAVGVGIAVAVVAVIFLVTPLALKSD